MCVTVILDDIDGCLILTDDQHGNDVLRVQEGYVDFFLKIKQYGYSQVSNCTMISRKYL